MVALKQQFLLKAFVNFEYTCCVLRGQVVTGSYGLIWHCLILLTVLMQAACIICSASVHSLHYFASTGSFAIDLIDISHGISVLYARWCCCNSDADHVEGDAHATNQ